MSSFKKERLGELLVHAGVITKAALKAAVALHEKEGRKRQLGDYLVKMGVCTEEDILHVAKVQRHMRNGSCEEIANGTVKQAAEIEELGDIALDLSKKLS